VSFLSDTNYYLYGTGGSAYYGPNGENLTLDNIWTTPLMTPIGFMEWCKPEAVMAKAFGLKRVAYEGGPSMDVRNTPDDAVQEDAWGDPRMQNVIVKMEDNAWSAADGELLVYYCATGHYAWSFAKSIFVQNTPKLLGIDQLNNQNKAPVTIGNVPPVTILGKNIDAYYSLPEGGWFMSGDAVVIKEAGYAVFMFRVDVAGTYNIGANISGTCAFILDGIEVGTETGSNTETPTYTMADLQPGLHTVMLRNTSGWLYINGVSMSDGQGEITGVYSNDSERNLSKDLSIYPNPANEICFLNFKSEVNELVNIIVVDIQGKIVSSIKSEIQLGSNNLRIDIKNIERGIYFIKVAGNKIHLQEKFIIK